MTVVQKQHKMSSWGLGSWDPAAKAHMMAYDKQLNTYTPVRQESILYEGMRK